MKIQISKKVIWTCGLAFLLAILIGLTCSLLLHNIGSILRGAEGLLGNDAETFGRIFDQLKTAEVGLPSVLLFILCWLEMAGVLRFVCGKKGLVLSKKSRILRGVGIAVPALFGIVLIMVVTLWFTDVNEIRFGTVIQFLYDAIQHGVF